MLIVTVNAGSSSIRLHGFDATSGALRCLTTLHQSTPPAAANATLNDFLGQLQQAGGPSSDIAIVVHRVVHGGHALVQPVIITSEVMQHIQACSPLAPLHNPAACAWIETARQRLGSAMHVAVFDTAFFANLPAVARDYALPRQLCERHQVRRYGFHGLAHQSMWQSWCAHHGPNSKIITLQLGSGCSAAAIAAGQPLDTSMGFTPLEGLIMSSRSGDVDPGLLTYLQRVENMTADEVERMLSHESGLRGISGASADMQTLLLSSSPTAQLAVAAFCYRIIKYIGAFAAVLEGLDGIVFGGGIGEHAAQIRARIVARLGWLGLQLDAQANTAGEPAHRISKPGNPEAWVAPVDESIILAQAGQHCFEERT